MSACSSFWLHLYFIYTQYIIIWLVCLYFTIPSFTDTVRPFHVPAWDFFVVNVISSEDKVTTAKWNQKWNAVGRNVVELRQGDLQGGQVGLVLPELPTFQESPNYIFMWNLLFKNVNQMGRKYLQTMYLIISKYQNI